MGENGPRFRLINLWETETDRQQPVLLPNRSRARKPEPFAQPQYGLEPPDRPPGCVEGLKAADPRHRSLDPERSLASTADRKNGPGLLSPPAECGMLVQPQQAATVCELDPVQHTIGSSKRAQTLDPNQRPENSHELLNLTLDLEHAHVSGHSTRISSSHQLIEQRLC